MPDLPGFKRNPDTWQALRDLVAADVQRLARKIEDTRGKDDKDPV